MVWNHSRYKNDFLILHLLETIQYVLALKFSLFQSNMVMNHYIHMTFLQGHWHGILASFYNAEICSCINGNPKIMMQFCYLGLYHYTETIYYCLSLSMARMEMDSNLKKLASFFKF